MPRTVYKWPTIKYDPDRTPMASYFHRQTMVRNNCINGLVTGGVGSSKSWSTLALKHELYPDEPLSECFFFKAGELFQAITNFYNKHPKKKGKMFIYDEAGVDLDALNYYNDVCRGIGKFMQTSRHRNYIFMMTVPQIRLITKTVRTLINVHWTAVGFNAKKRLSHIVPRICEYNDDLDKIYKKRLIVIKDHQSTYCNQINFPRPPKKVIKEYEKLKTEFTTNLMNEVMETIKSYEESKIEKSGIKVLTPKQKEILDLIKTGINLNKVAKELSLSGSTISDHLKYIRKKGIKITPNYIEGKIKGYIVEDIHKIAEN